MYNFNKNMYSIKLLIGYMLKIYYKLLWKIKNNKEKFKAGGRESNKYCQCCS